jgi:hypothetical protein
MTTGFPLHRHGIIMAQKFTVTMAADAEAAGEGDASTPLLLNQPIVIDNGTASIKAGFAGSSKPKVRAKKVQGCHLLRARLGSQCLHSRYSLWESDQRECFSICAFR